MTTANYKRWMAGSTPQRKKEVAVRAKTSLPMLYHINTGYRKPSSELAARIEGACGGELTRGDISETCSRCPYYKRGLK